MPTARPIRRITSAICSSTGTIWLGSAIRAVVAMTAVIASRTGIRAATAEPNTSSRITSVSGSAIMPAVLSMPLNASSTALPVLALPSSSMSRAGWRVSGLVDAGDDRVDVRDCLVVVALRAELDHRRVAVVRDQVAVARVEGRVELPHLRVRVERLHDILDCGLERRIVGGKGFGLDQDDLGLLVGRLREAGLDDLVCGGGLADGEVVLLEVLGADLAADDDGGDYEREPAEDGCLPVVRAPPAHAGGEIVAALQR